MRQSIFLLPVLLASILFSSVMPAHAAELYFGASGTVLSVGAPVEVGVFLNTQGKVDNAVAGTVHFSTDTFSLSSIRDGGSSITMWVERPHTAGAGSISFSGVTPGGFVGSKLYLFSIVLNPKVIGSSSVSISDQEVLINDGLGTSDSVSLSPISFVIGGPQVVAPPAEGTTEAPVVTEPTTVPLKDEMSPEPFAVTFVQDPLIGDGKGVLVFEAVDKDSGVDHYEATETFPWFDIRSWLSKPETVVTGSPYVLKDQSRAMDVSIVAIDRAGNRQESFVHSVALPPLQFFVGTWAGVVLLMVISGVFIWKKKHVH